MPLWAQGAMCWWGWVMRSYGSAWALIVSDSGGVEQAAEGGFLILGYQKSFSRL
jgi:hypothetical protein